MVERRLALYHRSLCLRESERLARQKTLHLFYVAAVQCQTVNEQDNAILLMIDVNHLPYLLGDNHL